MNFLTVHLWIVSALLFSATFAGERGILPLLSKLKHRHGLVHMCTLKLIKINFIGIKQLTVFARSQDLGKLHKSFHKVNASIFSMTPTASHFPTGTRRYRDVVLIVLSPESPDLTYILQRHLNYWGSAMIVMITTIASEAQVINITKILAHFEKVNAVIVAPQTPTTVGIYSFTPFRNECREWQPQLIDSCSASGFRFGKPVLPRNQRLDLRRCLLVSCSLPMPPVVVYSTTPQGEKSYSRFGGWLIDTLAEHINFTYKIYSPNDREWGMVYPNQSSDGCVRDVIDKTADFIMGDMLNIPQRYSYVAAVRSVNTLCITWAVPAIDILDQNILKILFSGFPTDLWMLLFTGFFLCLSALTIIAKVPFDVGIFFLVGAMLDTPPGGISSRWTPRVITLAWLYFSVVMNNIYRSQLLTLLSFTRKVDINTAEQVAATGFTVSAASALRATLTSLGEELKNPTLISLGNRTQIISDVWGSLQEVIKSQRSILLMSGNVLSYYIKTEKLYDEPGGVHMSLPCLVDNPAVQFFFRKASPIATAFDKTVLMLQEAGIVQYMREKEFLENGRAELELKSLSLSKIGSVFIILYTGYVLAFVVFLSESALAWYLERKRISKKISTGHPFLH